MFLWYAALGLLAGCDTPAPEPWIRVDPAQPAAQQEPTPAASRWHSQGGCIPSAVPTEDWLETAVTECVEDGASEGCLRAARTLGRDVGDDDARYLGAIRPALERRCEEREGEACLLLGQAAEEPGRMEQACLLGWGEACVVLDRREGRGSIWAVRACALGVERSCALADQHLRDTRAHRQRGILACGLAELGSTSAADLRDALVRDGLVPADICAL